MDWTLPLQGILSPSCSTEDGGWLCSSAYFRWQMIDQNEPSEGMYTTPSNTPRGSGKVQRFNLSFPSWVNSHGFLSLVNLRNFLPKSSFRTQSELNWSWAGWKTFTSQNFWHQSLKFNFSDFPHPLPPTHTLLPQDIMIKNQEQSEWKKHSFQDLWRGEPLGLFTLRIFSCKFLLKSKKRPHILISTCLFAFKLPFTITYCNCKW